jgi:hypothetical protein
MAIANAVTWEMPPKTASLPLIVAAAEATTSLGRPGGDLNRLLIAVQLANDGRAIRSVGESIVRLPIGEFVGLFTSVFWNNRVSQDIPLEPSFQLKLTLLVALRQSIQKVTSDCAYHVAAGLCVAAASGYRDFQLIAFPCLKILIDRFKIEGLDAQFTQLTQIAMTLDMSVIGGFLSSCLKGPSLQSCLRPLLSVRDVTAEYLAISTTVIRMSSEKVEGLQGFVPILMGPLKKMVDEVMKNQNPAEFRCSIRIWSSLSAVTGTSEIPVNLMLAFLCVELRNSAEPWVAQGDVAGDAAIVRHFPKQVDVELVVELFEAAVANVGVRDDLIDFSTQISKLPKLSENLWRLLFYSILNVGFTTGSIARMIDHFGPEFLGDYATELGQKILSGVDSEKEILALFQVLSGKLRHQSNLLMNVVVDWANERANRSGITFSVLDILAGKCDSFDYEKVARFTAERIARGGLQFMYRLIQKDRGIQVAVRVARIAAFLSLNDQQRAPLWLNLIDALADRTSRAEVDEAAGRAAVQCLVANTQDRDVVFLAAKALARWRARAEDACRRFWEALAAPDREIVLKAMSAV